MPIDNCPHTFHELATKKLPAHFKRLRTAIESPLPASTFVRFQSPTRGLLARLERLTDFPGCYVFIDQDRPVYVGISRGVVKRIVQHLNSNSHYSASLVYQMATRDYPHKMSRDQAMNDEHFKTVFFAAQDRLRQMKVAFIEVTNDLELYVFEVFAAMSLNTDTWNTFRTH